MKNIKNILALTLFAIVIFSCSSDNNPKSAAYKFLTAFNERKFDEARKYATPETDKLVDLMENISKMNKDKDSVVAKKVEVVNEKITGETATVTFREEGADSTQEIMMKKIDGKWLVHITKQDIAAKDMPGGVGGNDGLEPDSTIEKSPVNEDSLITR